MFQFSAQNDPTDWRLPSHDYMRVCEHAFRDIWREWVRSHLIRCGATERMAGILLDCGIKWELPEG